MTERFEPDVAVALCGQLDAGVASAAMRPPLDHGSSTAKRPEHSVELDDHRYVVRRLRLRAFLLIGIGRDEALRQSG